MSEIFNHMKRSPKSENLLCRCQSYEEKFECFVQSQEMTTETLMQLIMNIVPIAKDQVRYLIRYS